MTYNRPDNSSTLCCILILLTISIVVKGDSQDILNLKHGRTHLEEIKFPDTDYTDGNDDKERNDPNNDLLRDNIPFRDVGLSDIYSGIEQSKINISSTLDPNIKWDRRWDRVMSNYNFGQLSAVDVDLDGNIALFSRRGRIWGKGTFDLNNIFDINNGPIRENTIVLFDKNGKIIVEWGRNMFYLPHGLTIDSIGNYWITDVAMHQVFKFNAEDIEKNMDKLKQSQYEAILETYIVDTKNLFTNSILKPSLILGEAFQPGNDDEKFCKPTAVAVAKNGDFFVSDGYCNSRIIKFNSQGERILTIGHQITPISDQIGPYSLLVPHSLALAEELNFIYVADREHGRILCYHTQNISFYREYKNPILGGKIYGIAYSNEHLYIVNGHDPYTSKFHVRGYVMDINTGNIVSQFGPDNDMIAPHDIALNIHGTEIYVPELNNHVIYRFIRGSDRKITVAVNTSQLSNSTELLHNTSRISTDQRNSMTEKSARGHVTTLILTLIISALLLIGMCVAIAAVIARCQKRGCLLSVRRRGYWPNERDDNFKLSSLLTARQSKGFRIFDKRPNTKDFSKLNTEPETSDDEHLEDSLII